MTFGITAILSAKNLGETFGNIRGELTDIVTSQCFVAGTLVLTEDGEKPIEDIEVGDYVYASDPETGETGYKEVVQTFENETEELVHVYVNGDEIISTPNHPFYVPQKGWTRAVDLRAGDILVLSNGDCVVVEQVQHEILEAPVKVYNFEVQDFHTYYVGKNSILVHNSCDEAKIRVDSYDSMKHDDNVKGQVHHLSQDAAFRDVIPRNDGLCIELNGNAFVDQGSQHYNAHNSLEQFWDKYRPNGEYYGTIPTIAEYNKALYSSLLDAGLSKSDAAFSVRMAYSQQRQFDLSNKDLVPRIPGRINQKK